MSSFCICQNLSAPLIIDLILFISVPIWVFMHSIQQNVRGGLSYKSATIAKSSGARSFYNTQNLLKIVSIVAFIVTVTCNSVAIEADKPSTVRGLQLPGLIFSLALLVFSFWAISKKVFINDITPLLGIRWYIFYVGCIILASVSILLHSQVLFSDAIGRLS